MKFLFHVLKHNERQSKRKAPNNKKLQKESFFYLINWITANEYFIERHNIQREPWIFFVFFCIFSFLVSSWVYILFHCPVLYTHQPIKRMEWQNIQESRLWYKIGSIINQSIDLPNFLLPTAYSFWQILFLFSFVSLFGAIFSVIVMIWEYDR